MEVSNSLENFKFDQEVVGKGKHFVSRFIEPGAVSYGDAGVLKVSKEALDRFIQSFVACPVIIKHKTLTNSNIDEERVGVVNSVWYEPKDGWFYCDGVIWKDEAIDKIEDGWSVSCTYNMTDSTGDSGEWHNMHYDDELVNGVFEHLAIVPNPRYEEATILLNSKEEDNNMLLKLFNGKKSNEEKSEMVDKNALKDKLLEHINKAVKGKGEIDGQSEEAWYKALNEMLDKLSYSESEAEKSNEKEDEEAKEEENKCNESESEDKEEKKENSEEESKEEEKENSDEEEKKENSDDDSKDKEEEEEKEEEKENECKDTKENSKFDTLQKLHNSCDAEVKSSYQSEKSRIALGDSLF